MGASGYDKDLPCVIRGRFTGLRLIDKVLELDCDVV